MASSGLLHITQVGDFSKTNSFLKKMKERVFYRNLDRFGKKGVELLSASTPKKTGLTADSWSYELERSDKGVRLVWRNSNKGSDGKTPIAILIQMGHGTRNGGYVPPVDYINPVMQPLFDEIVEYIGRTVRQ